MTVKIDSYHPAYIGFDRLWRIFNEAEKSLNTNSGYPPYNLVDLGENKYLVEIAVAGFEAKDIDVTLQENSLLISAMSPENSNHFIHRGIAGRSFARRFTLADTIEVRDVTLEHGMLRITLENVIPEAKKPRKLEIRSGNPQLLVENNESTQKTLETNINRPTAKI